MLPEPILRILDANANRTREGIRTAEDYIRFAVGESRWARRLRAARHDVTRTIEQAVPAPELLATRNAGRDLGHPQRQEDLKAAGASPSAVARRGLKRAQEGLRVLEEYTRSDGASKEFARIRFELYEAEQWLALGSEAFRVLRQAQLYVLVTEALCARDWLGAAEGALRGGARIVQLREKDLPGAECVARACRLKDLCVRYEALCIVNDRADVARAAHADGVHVGQDDLAPADARQAAGLASLVGCSTHSLEQARKAVQEDESDYIAVGAMYATQSKRGYELKGPALAEAVARECPETPVFAIGGIDAGRARELKKVGVTRVAVSAAVIGSDDPEGAARQIVEALQD